jgi:hypothetical protein
MSKRHQRQASAGDPWRLAQVLATLARIGVELLKWWTGGGPDRL